MTDISTPATLRRKQGIVFMASGVPFLMLASIVHPAFIAPGLAFMTLGVVFLAGARKAG